MERRTRNLVLSCEAACEEEGFHKPSKSSLVEAIERLPSDYCELGTTYAAIALANAMEGAPSEDALELVEEEELLNAARREIEAAQEG